MKAYLLGILIGVTVAVIVSMIILQKGMKGTNMTDHDGKETKRTIRN